MMRIATWNVDQSRKYNHAKSDRQIACFDTVAADIWILTESHRSQSPNVQFVSHASDLDTAHCDGGVWVQVFTRWPILEKHETSDQLRSAAVTIRTPFGPLLVYGSVLPWRSDGAYAPLKGTEAFLHALDSQAKDWKKLRQKNRNCEFCLAGDFNQELSGSIFVGSKVGQSALDNALKQADLDCQTSGSDDPILQLTTQTTSSIDHICLSKELASRVKRKPEAWPKADKPDKNLSDHFCVYIDILDDVAVNK